MPQTAKPALYTMYRQTYKEAFKLLVNKMCKQEEFPAAQCPPVLLY